MVASDAMWTWQAWLRWRIIIFAVACMLGLAGASYKHLTQADPDPKPPPKVCVYVEGKCVDAMKAKQPIIITVP